MRREEAADFSGDCGGGCGVEGVGVRVGDVGDDDLLEWRVDVEDGGKEWFG